MVGNIKNVYKLESENDLKLWSYKNGPFFRILLLMLMLTEYGSRGENDVCVNPFHHFPHIQPQGESNVNRGVISVTSLH
jgi:hypothetical protein